MHLKKCTSKNAHNNKPLMVWEREEEGEKKRHDLQVRMMKRRGSEAA
jgi:hypothetical protein